MPWCVLLWVQLLWDSLGFLDFLEVYFLHQIGEVFFHYLFKYIFSFLLLLFSFWHPYNLDIGKFQVVPEVRKSLFTSLNSVLVGCLFFPFVPIITLHPCFLPVTVGSLNILLYFILGIFHLFFHFFDQAQSVL